MNQYRLIRSLSTLPFQMILYYSAVYRRSSKLDREFGVVSKARLGVIAPVEVSANTVADIRCVFVCLLVGEGEVTQIEPLKVHAEMTFGAAMYDEVERLVCPTSRRTITQWTTNIANERRYILMVRVGINSSTRSQQLRVCLYLCITQTVVTEWYGSFPTVDAVWWDFEYRSRQKVQYRLGPDE